jgi:hypothetical protein
METQTERFLTPISTTDVSSEYNVSIGLRNGFPRIDSPRQTSNDDLTESDDEENVKIITLTKSRDSIDTEEYVSARVLESDEDIDADITLLEGSVECLAELKEAAPGIDKEEKVTTKRSVRFNPVVNMLIFE